MIYLVTVCLIIMNIYFYNKIKQLRKENKQLMETCTKLLNDCEEYYIKNEWLTKSIKIVSDRNTVLDTPKNPTLKVCKFKLIVSDDHFEIYSKNNTRVAVSRIYSYKSHVVKLAKSLSESSGWEITTR